MLSLSYATGTVLGLTGAQYIGGLVGSNSGTVKVCFATDMLVCLMPAPPRKTWAGWRR